MTKTRAALDGVCRGQSFVCPYKQFTAQKALANITVVFADGATADFQLEFGKTKTIEPTNVAPTTAAKK